MFVAVCFHMLVYCVIPLVFRPRIVRRVIDIYYPHDMTSLADFRFHSSTGELVYIVYSIVVFT